MLSILVTQIGFNDAKIAFLSELTDNLSALLSGENDLIASLANTSALLSRS